MNASCRSLLTGLTVIIASFELFAAPAPKYLRSLEEDEALLLQKGPDLWVTTPVTVERDGKKQTFTPVLIISKGENIHVQFNGAEEFLKKPGLKGLFAIGISDGESALYDHTYYRIEEKDKQRFLVISDREGGEIAFTYEIEDGILRLKGGKAIPASRVGSLDLAREYKRTK